MAILTRTAISLLLAVSAHAYDAPSSNALPHPFEPDHWQGESHFFVGGGINSAVMTNEGQRIRLGAGSQLRTEWTHAIDTRTAVEVGAGFSFSAIDGFTIWDTALTLGLRRKLNPIPGSLHSSPYVRLFAGFSPTVVIFGDVVPDPYRESGAQRLQYIGPLGGAGLGLFRKADSGQVWYMEMTFVSHFYDRMDVVKSDKDVPVLVARTNPEHVTLQAFQLSFGLLAF